MSPRESPSIESSVERVAWVRGLARALVAGEHDAEDLAQEAWLAALRAGSPPPAGWRGWFAGVLRNLARARLRGDHRRHEREGAVAGPEPLRGQEELAERLETHELLVRAVRKLAEPYRSAIALRYFECLSPGEIAARTGVPVRTVETRLRRALQRLRESLDERELGDRGAWVALLLPLARSSDLAVAGAFAVSLKLKIAFAAVAVLTLLWGAHRITQSDSIAGSPPLPASADLVAPPSKPEPPLGQPSGEPQRLALEPSPAATPAAERTAAAKMRGHVLDANGNGLAGVRVGFDVESDPRSVLSGTGGEFELDALHRTVVSLDERFATVLASRMDPRRARPGDELTVVVAPALTLGGIVLDEPGRTPVVEATVQVQIPLSFRGRFREALDSSFEHWWCDSGRSNWTNRTDEQGRFLLRRVPGLPCATLVARASQGRSGSAPVPDHDELGLELVLTPAHSHDSVPGPDALHLLGEVRHADGRFAPGALVSLDGVTTRADEQALFELFAPPAPDVDPASPGRRLFAVIAGEQAAAFTPARDASGAELWPPFVRLRLGGIPRSIAGRVLGRDGEPIAAAEVWIDDVTFVGKTADHGFRTLEGEMARAPDEEEGKGRPWSRIHTDADGRFELTGLAERDYVLAARDPETLQITRVGPVAAGTRDVRLVLTGDELLERVAGRIVDSHGNPLAGLRVRASVFTSHVASGRSSWREFSEGAEVRTDESGSFELKRVARSGVTLRIRGDRFLPVELELDRVPDPLAIRIEVPWLGHLQIELDGEPEGGSIELLGPDGQPLEFHIFGGGSSWTRVAIELGNEDEFAGGRTPVLSVPDTVRAAVLRDAQGNELARVPVALGEELITLRL